jgi:ferric-dicitrate binding protein FerR (iron transport regulator)
MVGSVIVLMRRGSEVPINTAHVYATKSYQQAIVHLDDATAVTLAPQTTLRVLQFGKQARVVALENGEAYFEVAHSSKVPFMVRSGAVTAQVLGTAFLIRHEVRDAHVRVAVADGKVRVTTPARAGTGVLLTAGEIGDITDSTEHVSRTDDLAPGTEWMPGYLMFRDTPLPVVLRTVSRWYGYQFRYADKALGEQSVTMTISIRSSAEALAAIERVLAVNLTVVGDTVTLVPQPPPVKGNAPRIRSYDVWSPTTEVGR